MPRVLEIERMNRIARLKNVENYLYPILEDPGIKTNIYILVSMKFNDEQFMKIYNSTHLLMQKKEKVHKKKYKDMNSLRNILFLIIIYLKVYKHKYPDEEISPLQAYFLNYVVAHPEYLDILIKESVLSNSASDILKAEEISIILKENIHVPLDIQTQMLAEPSKKYFSSIFPTSKAAIFSSIFPKSKAAPAAAEEVVQPAAPAAAEEVVQPAAPAAAEEVVQPAAPAKEAEASGGKSRKRKSRRVKTRKMKERKSKKRNNRKDISKRIKTTRKKI